ncbi:MAG: NAD-dependent epimerase/dehydratase family protein, partial [Leptospiraceae bacterium]|nr:NAD-dependent epimerase/dehydratase family protein [Leptospiraceae bacterium]
MANRTGIIVTGSSGFLGKRLLELLRANGWPIARFEGDVQNFASCDQAFDVVVHLAAKTQSKAFAQDSWAAFETNVIGSQSVIEYCERTGARYIFASTSGVYRPSSEPVTETSPVGPSRPYA